MTVVFVSICAALLTRVDANYLNDIYKVSRSALNTTFNVLDLVAEMLDKLPPNVVRQYVPKNSTKRLYKLINSEVRKGVKNKITLSRMLFKNGVPYPAASAQQDVTQVGKLIDKVGKWTLNVFAPVLKKPLPSWRLYDTDPRWYPDCVGRYRCKRAHEYGEYPASRSLLYGKPQGKFVGAKSMHLNDDAAQAGDDACNRKSTSFNSGTDNSDSPYLGGKAMKHGRRDTGRVRPRDIKVNYLN